MSEPQLDKFGEFFVQNLRDRALNDVDFLLKGKWKAPGLQELQKRIADASASNRALIHDVVDRVVTGAMHDLLFALQEASDLHQGIQVIVDGKDVASLSDGLQGEIFTDKGWIKRFSKFPYSEKC